MTNLSDSLLVLFEFILLTVDIICNIFDDYLGFKLKSRLTVYIIQDLCQIWALIVLCLLFFRSSILESGLFPETFKKYSYALGIAIVYFIMTGCLQTLILNVFWNEEDIKSSSLNTKKWTKNRLTLTLFVIQRIFSTIHYYSYRRASSHLHDTKWETYESQVEMDNVAKYGLMSEKTRLKPK